MVDIGWNGPHKNLAGTLVERVWAWLHETFPERQIYIRSDGRVQFFTFGATLQATLALLALIFLQWVAFATVNVIFKDRIIAAKDHRYAELLEAYNGLQPARVFSASVEGRLIECVNRPCSNDLKRAINTELDRQKSPLARLHIWTAAPHVLPEPKIAAVRTLPGPVVEETSTFVDASQTFYGAVKGVMDRSYALISRHKGATIDDQSAFIWFVSIVWGALGLLVYGCIRGFAELARRRLEGSEPPHPRH